MLLRFLFIAINLCITSVLRSNWSVRFAVSKPGFNYLSESYKTALKASLLGAQYESESGQKKRARSQVVLLVKTLNGIPPS